MLKIPKALIFVHAQPVRLYNQVAELGNVFLISNRIVNIFLWHCPEDQVEDPSFHWNHWELWAHSSLHFIEYKNDLTLTVPQKLLSVGDYWTEVFLEDIATGTMWVFVGIFITEMKKNI